MARSLAALYGAGGALGLVVVLALPHWRGLHVVGVVAPSLGAAAGAGLLLAVGRRLPLFGFHLMVWAGTLLISVAMYAAGAEGANAFAIFYIWGPLYAFQFFTLRAAALHLAGIAVAYTAVLVSLGGGDHVAATVLLMVGAAGAAGVVAANLMGRIRALAFADPLTGLPNRRVWEDAVPHALAQARRDGRPLCLVVLNIDRLKQYVDREGYDAGDRLLRAVSQGWCEQVRGGDLVARLGGDEFGMLLPARSLHAAHELLRCMQAASPGQSTWSAGLALWDGDESPGELLRRADEALFRAKRNGRGLVMPASAAPMFAPDRASIERGELVVLYQPIVGLHAVDALHVEALLRWDHPERGRIGPAEFIPTAEENGMIDALGAWVLADACRQIADWSTSHPADPPLRVSVNLSPRQLAQPDLVEKIALAVAGAGISSDALCFEVTEGAVMEKPEDALATLQRLRRLGVQIAIDDFGTGYSSLSYLKRLPVDWLKVDRSFVEGVDRDASDVAIVRAIVGMARSLGLTVVAEGVERAEQLAAVRALGCDMAQGFYFSEAVPIDALTSVSSLAG
jgi:diguanylate cyclase (GGDEF)-like protein